VFFVDGEPVFANDVNGRFDLDDLERVATKSYFDYYGKPTSAAERLFVQRGIDAMRFAIAKAMEEEA
jgi:hypothetical protein